MPLVDPEEFADREVARVYIAGSRREAARVERALSEYGIDYIVDREPFKTHLLGVFPVQYDGLAFYVIREQAGLCRRRLAEAGLNAGLVEEDLE